MPLFLPFRDRTHAGQELAQILGAELNSNHPDSTISPVVYALPKGGLPVAAPIARQLNCALEVIVAKKITHLDNPELALGAVTADGEVIWSRRKPESLEEQQTLLQAAQIKASDQLEAFSAYCPNLDPQGMLALVVDDGVATGMTMAVALKSLKAKQPREIWICVPLAPLELIQVLESWCDRLITLTTPRIFPSVGRFYQQFAQVDAGEAIAILQNQQTWFSLD
ncbi:MAG: phosphoribosyltransferase [Oscillatoriales cyanobacterium SM2_3_0]|nr:phosphoribosyltransferase [Oscillatoriales cyanobacterium SM2_3_0]